VHLWQKFNEVLNHEIFKKMIMHIQKLILFIGIIILNQTVVFAQSSPNDTVTDYLKKSAVKLMKPHINMTYSYVANELINKAPDLSVEVPQLKDTVKYLDELKGNYNDWKAFVKIAKIYRRYGKEQSAYPYFVNAYSLIESEIKKDSLNAGYYSDMAQLYLDAGNQDYAQAYLNMTYQLNKEDTLALKLLPMYLATSGDIENAEKINKHYLQKAPDEIDPYMNMLTIELFKVLNDSALMNELKHKSPKDVFDFSRIKKALDEHKKNKAFLVLYHAGNLFALYIKYATIADIQKENIKLSEEDHAELNRLQKFFTKAISGSSYKNKHILYKSLGFIYILQNKPDEAIEQFRQMTKFWTQDELSNDYDLVFAVEYFIKKDPMAALKSLEEKIKLNEKLVLDNLENYIRLANVYMQMNEYDEAKKKYEKALSIDNKAVDAYLGLSVPEMLNMNFQESNKYLNKAYEINKNYYLTYALYGILTFLANDYEQAKGALQQALQLNPDNESLLEIYALLKN
jgi:tetratricopeptide (TPR) repeat protein